MTELKYRDLEPISREEFRIVFDGSVDQLAVEGLLRLAYHDQDVKWAEWQCSKALEDTRPVVRLAAATALSHVVRRQRNLDEETLRRVVALKSDPALGQRIEDVLDDVAVFVRGLESS